jgi:signal transduction histidine kinase
MVDGVIILDTENRIVDINPAALKIIKQAKTEVIGQLYNRVLPEWANVLVPKSKTDKEEAHIALDEINEQRYYALYFSSIFKRQRLTGYLIHIHDDTHRMQAENDARERIRLEAELAERKRMHTIEAEAEAAKLANKAKSEFLASMSHELRTPLNAGIGFAQVLREQDFGPLNDKQVEYLNDIITSGKHLLSLINDILDLSKIEAGKEEMKLSDINIKELLQGSLVMIKEKAATHKISLSLQVAPEMESLQIKQTKERLNRSCLTFSPTQPSLPRMGEPLRWRADKIKEKLLSAFRTPASVLNRLTKTSFFSHFLNCKAVLQERHRAPDWGW